MNTAKKTNILNIGKIVSKILEIICWMGVAALLFSAVAGIFNPEWMTRNMIADSGLTVNGVEMQLNQNASLASVIIVLLAAWPVLSPLPSCFTTCTRYSPAPCRANTSPKATSPASSALAG